MALSDLLYVAWFTVVGPLIDYIVFWPAFHRRSQADPARARMWLWAWTIGPAWVLVAVGAALWVANDRPWTEFGFYVPDGWPAIALHALTDLGAGIMAWLALREASAKGDVVEVEQPTGPQSR